MGKRTFAPRSSQKVKESLSKPVSVADKMPSSNLAFNDDKASYSSLGKADCINR